MFVRQLLKLASHICDKRRSMSIMNRTMKLNYRTASIADAERLKKLGLISYGRFQEALGAHWKTMKSSIEEMDYIHFLSYAQGFVCETENDIIGMAFLIPSGHPTDIFPSDASYIRLIGVHPDYDGKGIGKKLTVMCIDFAKEIKETTLMLHTSEFQNVARHIYETLGFVRIKDLPKKFGKQYYLYRLPL